MIAEDRETQHVPQPAPVAPAALRDIDPVSLWFTGSAAQPAHKPVAVPKPERVPDVPPVVIPSGVIEKREAQSKLEKVPVIRAIPRELELVPKPTEKPAAAAVPKPAPKPTEEPKSQPVSWTVSPPGQKPLEKTPGGLRKRPRMPIMP